MSAEEDNSLSFRPTPKNKDLVVMSKQQLVDRVIQLEAHVTQLKNILAKSQAEHKKLTHKSGSRSFDFNKYNTRHVALKILYLGWDYHGFTVQEDSEKTIEAVLFHALIKTKLIQSRETSNYHRCGRTDKGVSAFSQVISIDLRSNMLEGKGVKVRENGTAHERPVLKLRGEKEVEISYTHILNKVLPPEIRVLAWCPVNPDFSARFSCFKRTYKYFFPKGNLDLVAMRSASKQLIGEHDYRNLCKMDVVHGVTNYTRKIFSVDLDSIDTEANGGYDMCQLTVVGKAFLWHQIRCIVAILFLVGQGREQPQVIEELLNVEKHPRKPQYSMAAELPLVLFDCQFEDVEWIFESDWHEDNIKSLQELWTKQAVKTTMVKTMLDNLNSTTAGSSSEHATDNKNATSERRRHVLNQAECLLPGNKFRTYKPLWDRQKSGRLEERIDHYVKRRKLTVDTTKDISKTNSLEDNNELKAE